MLMKNYMVNTIAFAVGLFVSALLWRLLSEMMFDLWITDAAYDASRELVRVAIIISDAPLALLAACAGMCCCGRRPALFGILAFISIVLYNYGVLYILGNSTPIFIWKWVLLFAFSMSGAWVGWKIVERLAVGRMAATIIRSVLILFAVVVVFVFWHQWSKEVIAEKYIKSMIRAVESEHSEGEAGWGSPKKLD